MRGTNRDRRRLAANRRNLHGLRAVTWRQRRPCGVERTAWRSKSDLGKSNRGCHKKWKPQHGG
jgi:hypothetical protein